MSGTTSRRRSPPAHACAAALSLWLGLTGIAPAQVAESGALPSISLQTLETKIPAAPGVLADQSAIEAALDALSEQKAKAGLDYTYQAGIGPAAIIVPRSFDEHVLHFEQNVGVSLPVLGSRYTQLLAILDAQERAAVAKITYEEQLRTRVGDLRDSYALYWQYDTQTKIADAYVTTEEGALRQAQALRKSGFWTNYNLFDFFVMLQKIKTEASEFASSRRAQLAGIASAVGYEVSPFSPVEPVFFHACVPSRDRAIASAYQVDATLAILDAQIAEVRQELARVHGSSVEAHALASAGSQTDINYQVSGYDLNVGLDVSLPAHAREEERAMRAALNAQLNGLAFDQQQRRVELTSQVDAGIADVASAQATLDQALQERAARQGDVDKALVRYNTIRLPGAQAFDDVQQNRDNLYAAQRSAAEASAAVLLAANKLLTISPQACP